MKAQREKIESTDVDGNDVTVFVVTPTEQQKIEADKVNKRTFARLINETDENGKSIAILRAKLFDYARQQGLWSDELQEQKNELIKNIQERLAKLEKGGIPLKEAREMALEIGDFRSEMMALEIPLTQLKRYSLESQCENAEYDYLVSKCILDEEGKPVFDSVEDYKSADNHPWLMEACVKFSEMQYGLEENWEMKLPENEFLKKFKLIDDDMNLIDKDGNRVTRDGRLVSELEKTPEVEFQPFLDDEGNPIE